MSELDNDQGGDACGGDEKRGDDENTRGRARGRT